MTRKTLSDWTPDDLDRAERCLRFELETHGARDHIGWGLQAVATLRACVAEVARLHESARWADKQLDDERCDLAALLSALDVPEGVEPVAWARALYGLMEVACNHDETVLARRVIEHIEARVWPLRTPPRPLPDGPGWWWGSCEGGETRPWEVVDSEELGGLVVCTGRHGVYSKWSRIDREDWTWLAGPDGKAVRCLPPGAPDAD